MKEGTDDWVYDLCVAVRNSECTFESVELVSNEAHGRVAIALLNCLKSEPAGIIFAEPRTPDRDGAEDARPTDILILHPSLGALLIEVKGWSIDEITRIEAGTIFRRVRGYEEAKNPWSQVQNAAGQLQKATRRVIERRRLSGRQIPHFDWIVAFPNICRSTWTGRGFDRTLNNSELLLAEDMADPIALWRRMSKYIQAKVNHHLPFPKEQLDNVREALGSSYVISKRDRKVIRNCGISLGQAIDIDEAKDKRLSAEQIELIELEFDGHPQLIRGVAGSGKSLVLVRNCVSLVDRTINSQQMEPFHR